MDDFNIKFSSYLEQFEGSSAWPYVMLFIIFYGAHFASVLPKTWLTYLNNVYVRILVISIILWLNHIDPVLSLVLALIFVSVINLANNKGILESFTWEGPQTSIYPGCVNMTISDILESFGNDKDKLSQAIVMSKIPADVELTDYYAPIIATYLLYAGFNLKSPCTPPSGDEQSMW